MCEQDGFDEFAAQHGHGMTRRRFGALALGASVAAGLPRLSLAAADTRGKDVEVKTADGTCDAYFVAPAKGRHPGVLIWPDIFGLRPAFKDMATRLAGEGYAVLVVNPFYRAQRAPTAPPKPDFKDPAVRDRLMALKNSLTPQTAQVDAPAFIGFIDEQAATDAKRGAGVMGYCMGGPLALRTAAAKPGRIRAVGSYHGGGLVTDKPDSPHLLIPQMRAQFLVAIAADDDEKSPAVKDQLREAFAAAKQPAEVEVYAGTKHGWCPPDSPVYHHDQAEKAWSRTLALFKKALA